MRPLKIISGGQTGVDRAALDVAIELGIPHGGWCPLGRIAEDGRVPDRYKLQETDSADYRVRTKRNVRDADCTLIIARSEPLTGGTLMTRRLANEWGRPCFVVTRRGASSVSYVRDVIGCGWTQPITINIAGPRESKCPGIYDAARAFLLEVFS